MCMVKIALTSFLDKLQTVEFYLMPEDVAGIVLPLLMCAVKNDSDPLIRPINDIESFQLCR